MDQHKLSFTAGSAWDHRPPKTPGVIRRLLSLAVLSAMVFFAFPGMDASANRSPTRPQTGQSNVIFVDDTATGLNDGSSWADAFTGLQSALDAAQAGDEIWATGGTYWPSLRTDPADARSATFSLVDGVKLYGGFAGFEGSLSKRDWQAHPTILSGDIDHNDLSSPVTDVDQIVGENAYHVVKANSLSAETVIDGFIITAGNADLPPNSWGCDNDCGGGIQINSGNPTLTNLLIQGNFGGWGGGITIFNNSYPTLTNIVITDNNAENAGGMGIYASNPIVSLTTIQTNTAVKYGGGILSAHNSTPVFTNVTIANNQAGLWGVGIFIYDSSASLVNVTDINTESANPTEIVMAYDCQLEIRNSIIWGSSPDISSIAYDNAANNSLSFSFSDIRRPEGIVFPGEGNLNADPMLGKPGDYGGITLTIPLLPGSPAVDAVPPEQCTQADGVTPLSVDQRGVARPQGSACDMGAFEGVYYPGYLPFVGR